MVRIVIIAIDRQVLIREALRQAYYRNNFSSISFFSLFLSFFFPFLHTRTVRARVSWRYHDTTMG